MKFSTHFHTLLILTAAFVFASCIENPPSDKAYYDFWYGQMFTSYNSPRNLDNHNNTNFIVTFVV